MDEILKAVLGFLASGAVVVLIYFLKSIRDQMVAMNDKLISVITNQEWHYSSIKELQEKEKVLEYRLRLVEVIISKGVEL